jgi:hypothetical protein
VTSPVTAAITAPASGATFTAPATVNITATAADTGGTVTKVEFFADGVKIGEATTSPYSFSWTSVKTGTYRLTARATDNLGRTGFSAPVIVKVSATLTATADAYVRDGSSAGTNFGTATSLQVKTSSTGNNRRSYLKFSITNVKTTSAVTLRVFGAVSSTTSGSITTLVYPVATTSWSETGITWNNKPAHGSTSLAGASIVTSSTTARRYTFDVTSYVRQQRAAGHNTISFALENLATSTPIVNFNSREATSNKPSLSVAP